MKLRVTPRALADAKRTKTWCQRHRPLAPSLFDEEFQAALVCIGADPTLGTVYKRAELGVPVRRMLMPKTRNHVYYAIGSNEIVVLSIWGGPKGRGPKL